MAFFASEGDVTGVWVVLLTMLCLLTTCFLLYISRLLQRRNSCRRQDGIAVIVECRDAEIEYSFLL